eukprot:comp16627_c0_seq1/m.14809 comp16627_c0_seq1/g.14809  ORF comp16627_c0_seq1/g.14809 comp16627_c0_seq1/m.14809 type:complete len:196 (-) comp16627_c0_seq1:762-1349(-)
MTVDILRSSSHDVDRLPNMSHNFNALNLRQYSAFGANKPRKHTCLRTEYDDLYTPSITTSSALKVILLELGGDQKTQSQIHTPDSARLHETKTGLKNAKGYMNTPVGNGSYIPSMPIISEGDDSDNIASEHDECASAAEFKNTHTHLQARPIHQIRVMSGTLAAANAYLSRKKPSMMAKTTREVIAEEEEEEVEC